jgi:hypothetical protein
MERERLAGVENGTGMGIGHTMCKKRDRPLCHRNRTMDGWGLMGGWIRELFQPGGGPAITWAATNMLAHARKQSSKPRTYSTLSRLVIKVRKSSTNHVYSIYNQPVPVI